jgi:hypothetical protein
LRKPEGKFPKWWTIPPVVIVLSFNLGLEILRPRISSSIHFLFLIAASIVSFGVSFGIAWFIARLRKPWRNS